VSERVQEPTAEPASEPATELLSELSASAADETAPVNAPSAEGAPQSGAHVERSISWLRMAYSIEYLLAVLVIFTFWSEVGGQGHLDMMPWYTKMISVLASAWCCVRLTAGLVEERTAWNRRTVAWLAGLILVTFTMAAITYYYHLHEETDQPDSDENTASVMSPNPPGFMRSSA
jgi:hypothetical protein